MPIAETHAAITREKRQRPRRIVINSSTTGHKELQKKGLFAEPKPDGSRQYALNGFQAAIVTEFLQGWAKQEKA